MSRAEADVLVGAVAYHPRIVTIWEAFLEHFDREGVSTDYLLYSNYERLVEAVLAGDVEMGWNTNTAFVALERRLGGEARILGMRDVDAQFATLIVTRRGETFDEVTGLRANAWLWAAATQGMRPSSLCTIWPSRDWMLSQSASSCDSTPTSASTATRATRSCG